MTDKPKTPDPLSTMEAGIHLDFSTLYTLGIFEKKKPAETPRVEAELKNENQNKNQKP